MHQNTPKTRISRHYDLEGFSRNDTGGASRHDVESLAERQAYYRLQERQYLEYCESLRQRGPPVMIQMIDRTVEEFGEDWDANNI